MAILELVGIGAALTQLLLRSAELYSNPNGDVAASAVGDVASFQDPSQEGSHQSGDY